MSNSKRRRLAHLEERVMDQRFAPGWLPEEVVAKVVDELDFALATDSPVDLCREEMEAAGMFSIEDLPEHVRPHIRLRPSTWGTIRHRYKDSPQRPFVGWRGEVRQHEERVRAFEEESRQRDRELVENNRRSVGLPPLTSEQLAAWNLESTLWEEP